jgi:hypothetical protein
MSVDFPETGHARTLNWARSAAASSSIQTVRIDVLEQGVYGLEQGQEQLRHEVQ